MQSQYSDVYQPSQTMTINYNSIENAIENATQPQYFPSIHGTMLRSITELPEKYRKIFPFPYFNIVQSSIYNELLNSDKPLVLCSPTGSGKTAIFELAIIRLLMKNDLKQSDKISFKVIYMAPLKVLCNERKNDWESKFNQFGLKCLEVTGDSDIETFHELTQASIIITTPEKWDYMTRNWKDYKTFMKSINLFCIDEVHMINDGIRGATMEAVISRMKTIRTAKKNNYDNQTLRFIAVSATLPNVQDVAAWLGTSDEPGVHYKFSNEIRPVKIDIKVMGIPCPDSWNNFQFENNLTYKLDGIIKKHYNLKPTLVFCASRKSTEATAQHLAKTANYLFNALQRSELSKVITKLKLGKLKDTLYHGVGFHHAGLDLDDRRIIENAFKSGIIPVLLCTSTLSMGVNLPAHLVIIKSTTQYMSGGTTEYSDIQLLQMIGRAGRPQYDTSATAIILTTEKLKKHYENVINGTQIIESNLHRHLIEHLNAEIVLKTITDTNIATEWIKSTFFYIRILKNPKYYGLNFTYEKKKIDAEIEKLSKKELHILSKCDIIKFNENGSDFVSTDLGKVMAKYCISLQSIKRFIDLKGNESLSDLLNEICQCEELIQETQLRINERKALNLLNKNSKAKAIRFPMNTKIKSIYMKINCLLQAAFGCLVISDISMNQDLNKLLRSGQRVSKCLLEVVQLKHKSYNIVMNAVLLAKCFRAKIWYDSEYVTKQLNKIGFAMSTSLVEKGIKSFQHVKDANPREIESILKKHPPFGNKLQDAVSGLPMYSMEIEQIDKELHPTKATVKIVVKIDNFDSFKQKRLPNTYNSSYLIIGNSDDKLICNEKVSDNYFIKNQGVHIRIIDIDKPLGNNSNEFYCHFINEQWVGLDVDCIIFKPKFKDYELYESWNGTSATFLTQNSKIEKLPISPEKLSTQCDHPCRFKATCRHKKCCKRESETENEFETVKQVINSFFDSILKLTYFIFSIWKLSSHKRKKNLVRQKEPRTAMRKLKAAQQKDRKVISMLGLPHLQRKIKMLKQMMIILMKLMIIKLIIIKLIILTKLMIIKLMIILSLVLIWPVKKLPLQTKIIKCFLKSMTLKTISVIQMIIYSE